MTEEHSRTPWSVRGPILAPDGPSDGAMAYGSEAALVEAPHPDFLARAAIWRDHRAGLISLAEARRRSSLIGAEPVVRAASLRPQTSALPKVTRPRALARHQRPAPQESRQYAQPMATTAARDDRLTPNAKAFLQVLRARCGKGRETTITKGTAANIRARSPRTSRRYLADLVRFGYIELRIRVNARGLHLGLTVTLTDLVTPFYEDMRQLGRWLAEAPEASARSFAGLIDPAKAGVTCVSPRNQVPMNPSLKLSAHPVMEAFKGLKKLWREGRASAVPVV